MNSEQIQDWLTELNAAWKIEDKNKEVWRKELTDLLENTQTLITYLNCNFEDISLSQPIIAQLLSIYYRLGRLYFFKFINV